MRKCLDEGKQVNPIEVVYAPLYNNHGASYEDVYREVAEIIFRATKSKHEQVNLLVLSALLVNKIVGEKEYNRILEVVKMALTSFEALDMLVTKLDEARIKSAKREQAVESAKVLLELNIPVEAIVKSTGLTRKEVAALQESN